MVRKKISPAGPGLGIPGLGIIGIIVTIFEMLVIKIVFILVKKFYHLKES